jgi:integrase
MRYAINKNKYLSPAELTHLNTMIEKDMTRDGLLIKLALATGARAQELLNLTHSDLDDANRSVFIRGLKNSSDREIPLEKPLYDAIRALNNGSNKLFNIGYSRLVLIWAFYRPVKKNFHALRHTFAIELYRRTKDLLLIQAALGHRSLNNTLVYTTHLYQTEMLRGVLVKSS